MNTFAMIYAIGAISTLIFLLVSFVAVNHRYGTQLTWKDVWISFLGIAAWPVFWFLLIASKLS